MSKKRRSQIKYPGLVNKYNSKIKQEYLDQDYIKKLSPEEKQFLSDFNEEYYGANLDFEDLENNRFHKTEKEKKDCTDRNNARNRCVYGISKTASKLDEIDKAPVQDTGDIEDLLIEYIDIKDEESQ